MLAVISLNCLLAVLVSYMALGLWRWRCQLQQLTAQLHSMTIAPKQVGYAITLKRVQLAEARLGLARLQQRSQQARQTLQLVKLLRLLLLYRSVGRSVDRSVGRSVGSRALLPGPLLLKGKGASTKTGEKEQRNKGEHS